MRLQAVDFMKTIDLAVSIWRLQAAKKAEQYGEDDEERNDREQRRWVAGNQGEQKRR